MCHALGITGVFGPMDDPAACLAPLDYLCGQPAACPRLCRNYQQQAHFKVMHLARNKKSESTTSARIIFGFSISLL